MRLYCLSLWCYGTMGYFAMRAFGMGLFDWCASTCVRCGGWIGCFALGDFLGFWFDWFGFAQECVWFGCASGCEMFRWVSVICLAL